MRVIHASVIAACLSAPLLAAAPASAQVPSGPETLPWEKQLERIYERERRRLEIERDPYAGPDRALRRLDDDLERKLGLPRNAVPGAPEPQAPSAPPGAFDPGAARLDADGDGTISRREYFYGRRGPVPAGEAGRMRRQRMNQRLGAQFDSLDANRDGRISVDEYAASPGSRF